MLNSRQSTLPSALASMRVNSLRDDELSVRYAARLGGPGHNTSPALRALDRLQSRLPRQLLQHLHQQPAAVCSRTTVNPLAQRARRATFVCGQHPSKGIDKFILIQVASVAGISLYEGCPRLLQHLQGQGEVLLRPTWQTTSTNHLAALTSREF